MIRQNCRCPMCRRFASPMKKIADLDGPPLSDDARKKIKAAVDEAYAWMARNIPLNAGES